MVLFLLSIRLWLFYPTYVATLAFAFWRGAGPERAVATTFVASFLIFQILRSSDRTGLVYASVNMAQLVSDVGMTIVFVLIAVFANRMYTLWIAGFQIVALQAHLARFMTDEISPIAYAIMVIAPIYLQIIALAIGTWLHTRRVRRYGNYRSWRISSFRWPEKMRVG